jgi:hypothetical protein
MVLSSFRKSLGAAVALLSIAWLAGASGAAPGATGIEAHSSARRTERVILVTLDGLRWQEVFGGADEALVNKEHGGVEELGDVKEAFWRDAPEKRREALMPFLWSVVGRDGQIFGNVKKHSLVKVANEQRVSYPGYNELLAGAPDPRIKGNDKIANPNVTVLEWLNAKPDFKDKVAAFCSWDAFTAILNRERSHLFVNAGLAPVDEPDLTDRQRFLNDLQQQMSESFESRRADSITFQAGFEWIKKHKPRVAYFNLSETDHWAHAGRYDLVLAAAHEADAMLRELWDSLQSMPDYRGKTTLIVTTDHGRGDAPVEWKSHDGKTKGAEYIWIAALGPEIASLGERSDVKDLAQGQVAATVASLLGEDFNAAAPAAAPPIEDLLRAR